jgi:hypothetical protein
MTNQANEPLVDVEDPMLVLIVAGVGLGLNIISLLILDGSLTGLVNLADRLDG